MAEIFPFPALRYAPNLPLANLVTQPYDKITPQMQERYYEASPHNLVRIILGKKQLEDNGQNVYTRAAGYLKSWRTEGVLLRDEKACIYAYSQQFTSPEDGREFERRGFITAGKLHDYAERVVFRHEQTLSAPKTDRLNLLRATRAHFGQIFMLYSDPGSTVESQLSFDSPATAEVTDEYGVVHRLWPIGDPATIARVRSLMSEKQLIIADGHHRYETALAYRNEQRAASGAAVTDAPYERVMMTFINMDSPGLLILPTHRVVSGLKPEAAASFMQHAADFFSIEEIKGTLQQASSRLKESAASGCALLLATSGNFFLLRAKRQPIYSALPALSGKQRALDVVVLHKIVLERIFGLSEESIRNQENVSYYRDAEEAARVRAASGSRADFAFLMNPVRIGQMRDVALAGEVMPQKSTDFYPKLLSGLAIYALD